MPLEATNVNQNRFYWMTQYTPSAAMVSRRFVIPFPCRVSRIAFLYPGAAGGGTDFLVDMLLNGVSVGTAVWAVTGSSDGLVNEGVPSDWGTRRNQGDVIHTAYVSGAWTTTTAQCVLLFEFEAV